MRNKFLRRGLPVIGLGLGVYAVARGLDYARALQAEATAARCRIDRVPSRSHRIREAGPDAMASPPRDWDIVDEQADASFPASDPPGAY